MFVHMSNLVQATGQGFNTVGLHNSLPVSIYQKDSKPVVSKQKHKNKYSLLTHCMFSCSLRYLTSGGENQLCLPALPDVHS